MGNLWTEWGERYIKMDKRSLEQAIEPVPATIKQVVKSFFAKDPKPKKLSKKSKKKQMPSRKSLKLG